MIMEWIYVTHVTIHVELVHQIPIQVVSLVQVMILGTSREQLVHAITATLIIMLRLV